MKKLPIGYQLYSARREAEQDLLSVLRTLAAQGYDGVEFAGFYGHSAEEICAMLKETGLKAVSSHVGLHLIEADMQGTIDFHKAIGCQYIAVPYLMDDRRPGTPGFASVIRTVAAFGRLCCQNGIQLLYHNHDFEFAPFSGMYGLDFLYEAICPEILQTEIDTCWVKYAGEDPCAYLRKYAGRAPVVHLKDYVGRREGGAAPYGLLGQEEAKQNAGVAFEFRPFGYGCQDAAAVVSAAIDAGAQWVIVEQDESVGRTPLEAAEMSIGTLKKLGLK